MNTKITLGIRLVLMLVDHFAMTIIVVLIAFITFGFAFIIQSLQSEHWSLYLLLIIMVPFIFSVYINKDALNGQSPAKRILKYKVIDVKTNEIASPLKCLIRNLILPVWIIEIPFVIFNPEQRLGDMIAGTKVVQNDFKIKSKLEMKKVVTALSLGMVYMAIFFFINFLIILKSEGVSIKELLEKVIVS